MTLSRDQELWGMALWVEKHHGDAGADFIARKVVQLTGASEPEGAALWREVASRFEQLSERTTRF